MTPDFDALKRERRGARIAAAISDGISSITNALLPGGKRGNAASSLEKRIAADDRAIANRLRSEAREQKAADAAAKQQAAMQRHTFGTDGPSVLKTDWDSKDYINQLFDTIESRHSNDQVSRHIDRLRYSRRRESTLSRFGNRTVTESLYDRLGERGSEYVKREIIRQLMEDDVLDGDALGQLRQEVADFDTNWSQIK